MTFWPKLCIIILKKELKLIGTFRMFFVNWEEYEVKNSKIYQMYNARNISISNQEPPLLDK